MNISKILLVPSLVVYLTFTGTSALAEDSKNQLLDKAFWKTATLQKVQQSIANGNAIKVNGNKTPLTRALISGASIDIIKYLLEQGADVNKQVMHGCTNLCWAAYGADVEVFKLIASKADESIIDYENDDGRNLLYFAVKGQKNLDVIKYLIEQGLDINYISDDGENVLHFATSSHGTKSPEVTQWLIDNVDNARAKNDDGDTALLKAAYRSNLSVIGTLLNNGFKATETNNEGRNALSIAAYRNSKKVIEKFIELGLDVNQEDNNGKTPLMYAVSRNRLDVVQLLIDNGADVNAVAKDGTTALIEASLRTKSKRDKIIALLLEKGAKANVVNSKGMTPLIAACKKNAKFAVLEALIKAGVNVNAVDRDKMTALMYLALKGRDEKSLELLLDNGAKTHFADDFDDTAYNMILENETLKNSSVVNRLKQP